MSIGFAASVLYLALSIFTSTLTPQYDAATTMCQGNQSKMAEHKYSICQTLKITEYLFPFTVVHFFV